MRLKIYFTLFSICVISFKSIAQNCGSVQSLTNIQESNIQFLLSQLETALSNENLIAIDSLNVLIKSEFNTEAGKPEAVETYFNLTNNSNWLDLTNSINLSRRLIQNDSLTYVNLWKLSKGMAPTNYLPHSIFLRTAAETAVGLLKIASKETDLFRKSAYEDWAIKALDSLATMQLQNGAFPFPDLRTYNDPTFSTIIQNFLNSLGQDSILALQNGWIVNDFNTGEFKFDAGVIGNAYYEAYIYTGNLSYKNIAISVANYLLPLKLNSNYNYNTFVSLGLTRGFQLNNDTNLLNRAILNLRYGLFPGQTLNGRWVDGHNANSRYHNIIISNIIPTINNINLNTIHKDKLDSMTQKAIQNLISYSYDCGAATGFKWLIASYLLSPNIISSNLKDSINQLIGRHINQSNINGKFLDVQTMGNYLELLDLLNVGEIKTIDQSIIYNLFPNPVTNEVNLEIKLSPESIIKLSLTNEAGIELNEKYKFYFHGDSSFYTFNLELLENGIYFLKIDTSQGQITKKIVLDK